MERPSVTILWGEWPDIDTEPVTYKFKTEDEKKAFLLGVYKACGWFNCKQSEEIIEIIKQPKSLGRSKTNEQI